MSRSSDKYGAAARINLNALSASKFKALFKKHAQNLISSSGLNFMARAPVPYQI
ncbi:hypothetical protein [uncultured Campylobacter sp.]|uniref:hypothetical protein n=1 Tax=uncultured Campylobacter sp. TaxID=218934 RepID=UPI00261AF1A5|nr:hypothetical protein [uncultured Campylobacter sp.]